MIQHYSLKSAALFLALIFVKFSYSQKEINNWYFGRNAGLNFNSGIPVPLFGGQLNTSEGCSSISDCSGNLLFYTDGIKVWNKKHFLMPNGVGLKGHNSSTQSTLIVQKPESETIFYIFTVGTIDPYNGQGKRELYLNELDLSLNGGLGDVTKKNILLNLSSCEKLTGIRHCDGKNIWVVSHDWGSSAFRCFSVNSLGVDLTPVLSSCGIKATGSLGNSIGQLKGSPDGTSLASAIEGTTARFEIFDFNNSTGIVSNPILMPSLSMGCYGVEFSPDGTKLYGGTASPTKIFQFDLNAGTPDQIAESVVEVGTAINNILFGSFQLGPDKKIYVARGSQATIGVINEPNKKGIACKYVNEGVDLGNFSTYGLPNMVSSYAKITSLPFTCSVNCLQGFFSCQKTNGWSPVISAEWNFGDPSTNEKNFSAEMNPMHLFSGPGTYYVSLKLFYKCSEDIIVQKIIIDPPVAEPTDISGVNAFCSDKKEALWVNVSGTYLWNTGDTSKAISAGPLTKNYSVIITTSAGCTYTAAKTVSVNPVPFVTSQAYSISELTSALIATGGTVYQWSPTIGLDCSDCDNPLVNYAGTTTYCVRVTDDKGCSGISCVELLVSSVYIPNAFTPNEDELNEVFMPVLNEVHDYNFLIYDRWGNKLFETSQPEKGWDGYFKGRLCEENIYVYKISFMDNEKNEAHEYAGKVALIK